MFLLFPCSLQSAEINENHKSPTVWDNEFFSLEENNKYFLTLAKILF